MRTSAGIAMLSLTRHRLPLDFAFQLAPAAFDFVPVHGLVLLLLPSQTIFRAPLLQPAFKIKRSAIDSCWRRLGPAA